MGYRGQGVRGDLFLFQVREFSYGRKELHYAAIEQMNKIDEDELDAGLDIILDVMKEVEPV